MKTKVSPNEPSTVRLFDPKEHASLAQAVADFQANKDASPSLSLSVVGEKDLEDENNLDVASAINQSIYVDAPINGPDWLVEKIQMQANFAQRLGGTSDWTIGSGAGSVTQLSLEEKRKEKEQQSLETMADLLEDFERVQEHQMEIERSREFMQTDHTFAGQTLSGEEWKALSDWFKNPKNEAAWEDAMMAETGQTREEVRRTGGKMRRFYELVDMQAQGKQLTSEQQAEFNQLNNDEDVKKGVTSQQRLISGADNRPTNEQATLHDPLAERNFAQQSVITSRSEMTELFNSPETQQNKTDLAIGSDVLKTRISAAPSALQAEALTPVFNPASHGQNLSLGIAVTNDIAPVRQIAAAMNSNIGML